jgi:hypothetical protein
MSATKCGNSFAIILPTPAPPKVEELPALEPALSHSATQILKRIQAKFPEFYPLSESAVWQKARSMGFTDEE